MELSKHNIFGKLKDSENYFIINPLTKQADILLAEKANELKTGNFTDVEEYKEKGY